MSQLIDMNDIRKKLASETKTGPGQENDVMYLGFEEVDKMLGGLRKKNTYYLLAPHGMGGKAIRGVRN